MEAERGHGGAQDPIVSQQKFPETPPTPLLGPHTIFQLSLRNLGMKYGPLILPRP